MPKDKTYKTKSGVYTIPDNESASFLKDFPDAVEVQSYKIDKDTYDIPITDTSDFLKQFPNAKPLGYDSEEIKNVSKETVSHGNISQDEDIKSIRSLQDQQSTLTAASKLNQVSSSQVPGGYSFVSKEQQDKDNQAAGMVNNELNSKVKSLADLWGQKPEEIKSVMSQNPLVDNADKLKEYTELKQVNPSQYQRLSAISNIQYGLAKDVGVHVANQFNELQTDNADDIDDLIGKTKQQQDLLKQYYSGKELDDKLNLLAANKAPLINTSNKKLLNDYFNPEVNPYKNDLNEYEYAGLRTLQLLKPELAKQYEDAIVNDRNVKFSDFNYRKGIEEMHQQLQNIGVNNLQSFMNERLADINQQANNATPEQLQLLKSQFDDISSQLTDVNIRVKKFPLLEAVEADEQMKEMMGYNPAYGKSGFGNLVTHAANSFIGNPIESLNNIVTNIFGSDADINFIKVSKKGDATNPYDYVPEELKSVKSNEIWQFSQELQDKAAAIQNRNLSDEEKYKQTAQLIKDNKDKIQLVENKDAGQRANLLSKATLFNNAATLGDIIGLAMGGEMGLFGKATKIQSALSNSVPMFLSMQDDFYKKAVENGEANPMAYANVHAAILASAALINPDLNIAKRALGINTTAGKILAGVDEKTWQSVIDGNKSWATKIKNSVTSVTKEASKMAAIYGAGTSIASDLADKFAFNKPLSGKEILDNAVESVKDVTINSLALFGINAISNFKDVSLPQKYRIYQLGDNPQLTIEKINDEVKKGNITQEEANKKISIVEQVAGLRQLVPELNARENPLTPEQQVSWLYNNLQKQKAIELSKNIPEQQKEKVEQAIAQADAANNIIYEDKTEKQLQTKKEQLEKQLEEKNDKGENVLSDKDRIKAKGELKAINDRLSEIQNETKRNENIKSAEEESTSTETTNQVDQSTEKTTKAAVIMPDEIKRPQTIEISTEPIKETTTPTEPPPSVPADELPFSDEGRSGGIRHADTSELRLKHGLPEYERTPEKSDEWDIEAYKRIKKGYPIDKLLSKIEKGGLPDKIEQRILDRYVSALDKELSNNPTEDNLARFNRAVHLSDKAGSEVARSLVSRKQGRISEDSFGQFVLDKQRAVGIDKLNFEQIKEEQKKYADLKEAHESLQVEMERLKNEQNTKAAEETVKKEASKSKEPNQKKSSEQFIKERKEIVNNIREKLKKSRGQLSATPIPFAKELIDIAPDIVKLAGSYLEEGISKLDDIITKIHDEIKGDVDVTKNQIRDILAGDYPKEKEGTRNEKAAALRLLQKEAKLLNAIEAARKGEENAKTSTQKNEKTRRIAELEQQLKDIKKQQKEKDAEEAPDEAGAKTDSDKNKTRQANIQKKIQQLQIDLKNKNYAKELVKRPKLVLDKKTQELQDKYIKLERQRRLELAKDEYERMSKWRKRWDKAQQILGLRRLIQTAIDLSVSFRQGVTLALNPRQWDVFGKSMSSQLKSVFSQKNFDRIMFDIESNPEYTNALKDGVHFNDLKNPDPLKHNEDFQKSFFYKIPWVSEPFKASNRAADSFLNTARMELYTKMVGNLERQGLTRETDPKAFEHAAKWTMNMTGRGSMIKSLEQAGGLQQILGSTFYGARLMASRFNLLNPYYYTRMPSEVRKQALGDIASTVGVMVLTGLAAKAAGAKVGLDPDDADFLKVRAGNNVYDITGGLGTYVKLYTRLTRAAFERASATKYEANKATDKAGTNVGTFFRNKLAPNTSYGLNWWYGKNTLGQDFNPYEIVQLYPMYVPDVIDSWEQQGALSMATTLLPSLLGIGYANYPEKAGEENLQATIHRNTNSDELDKSKIKKYVNGQEEPITDKEFEEYAEKRDAKIKAGIEKLYKEGYNVIQDYTVVKKQWKDLTREQKVEATSAVKRKATEETKKEMFPVPQAVQLKKEKQADLLKRANKRR